MTGRNRSFRRIHVVGLSVEQRIAHVVAAAGYLHQIVVVKVGIEFVEFAAVLGAVVSSRCWRWAALLIAAWTAVPVASLGRAPFAAFFLRWSVFAVALCCGASFAGRIATFGSATSTPTTPAWTPQPGIIAFGAAWSAFMFSVRWR
jgi:hypothetical protein